MRDQNLCDTLYMIVKFGVGSEFKTGVFLNRMNRFGFRSRLFNMTTYERNQFHNMMSEVN